MNSSCFACENKPAYNFAGFPTLKPACGEHKVDGMTEMRLFSHVEDQHPHWESECMIRLCPVEVKMMTAENTVAKEVELAANYGSFMYVNICDDPGAFRAVMPKSPHRLQCVQHMVGCDSMFCLYVVAGSGPMGIIRMVL